MAIFALTWSIFAGPVTYISCVYLIPGIQLNVYQCTFSCSTGIWHISNKHDTMIKVQILWFGYKCCLTLCIVELKLWNCEIQFHLQLACLNIYRKAYRIWLWDIIIILTSYYNHNQSTKKYNAIAAVVYYNPQSILVTLPINLGGFNSEIPGFLQLIRGHCFNINCNIDTRDFPNIYVLHPLACGP